MVGPQEAARSALRAAIAESKAQTAPAPGPAVRRLQALAGLVPSGDRTLDQVRRQIAAFATGGVDRFEVQPIPPKGAEHLKRERIRTWTAEQIEKGLGWLKRANAQGYDIYVRPAAADGEAAPFVFVDDIDRPTVEAMRQHGLPFAVLTESSPERFHGWIRVADEPVSREEATKAAQLVAARYGGDPASGDWRHYGRLVGFTNRKPSRRTPRGAPFAMLREAAGEVAPGGPALLAQARQALENEERLRQRAAEQARNAAAFPDHGQLEDAARAFAEARSRAVTTQQGDESARDFSACLSLLRRGYSADQVTAAMREASPGLEERHQKPDDYIERTVARAAERIQSTPGYN